MQGALVGGAGLREGTNAELALQDGGAALELAERGAAVSSSGVKVDEVAVDVLRQLVGGEVAAGIPNSRVVFPPCGIGLDEGRKDVEIATLTIPLLLENPRLKLRTPGQGEASQERSTVEIRCAAERLDAIATIRELIERDEIGPYALSVEADPVPGDNQEIRFGQGMAQMREEAGKTAAGLRFRGVGPEEETETFPGDEPGPGRKAI
jgi:hypothetical protein